MAHPMLTKELLSVLVCPKDRGELSYSSEKNTLTCQKCGHVYLIKNGVPNMLK
ncbi:MAG: Trm112 family protein [Candidatus Diapherotrites archaeon]|uniref:Trm112 family protein n=1 Tax=Candidatus Iainarchaeum sp. TaxID=3101447 RepID=A0A8T4C6I8_9ARCH|nr:Trm112 family protein [Candidatus Diapherotrites archaeon]